MPTTVSEVYPDPAYTAHDQVFGSDVDKMLLSLPSGVRSDTTKTDFGTSGNKDITLDPNNTRATTGIVDTFGWAVDDADMDSTATAKRRIIQGNWTITGEAFSAPVAALNAVRLFVQVFRVAASPSFARTLVVSSDVNLGLLSAAGISFNFNMGLQSEIILEANETLMLVLYVNATGQAGGLTVTIRVGDGNASTNPKVLALVFPASISTRYLRTHTVAGAPTAVLGPKRVRKAFTVAGAAAASFSRRVTLARSFTVAGTATAADAKKTFVAATVAGSAGAEMFVKISQSILNRITGAGAAVRRIFHIFDD